MTHLCVRRAERTDIAGVLALIEALARFEKLDPPGPDERARFVMHGWPEDGSAPKFQAWIAERESHGEVRQIGYAITFFTYSSFLCRPTLYLEDLFVMPDERRAGAGRAMITALAREAVTEGCGRMEWVVLDWNTNAQRFYHELGGEYLQEWQYYRLSGDALQKLGAGDNSQIPTGDPAARAHAG